MQVYLRPSRDQWRSICERPSLDLQPLMQKVRELMQEIRLGGDEAVRTLTARFDNITLEQAEMTEAEKEQALRNLTPELRAAMDQAYANIRRFHETQLEKSAPVETMPGVTCWRKQIPIQSVGLYIPGGSAPLFSTVLMLGVPAQLCGCQEVVLCSPPASDGTLHPAIVYAAAKTGIRRIFRIGGVQAIAAMTYGTETIPAVSKIFGPGNQYVTAAKQVAQLDGVAIDMPAGPSEVCVLADGSADPAFVAADLLSQAEHGPDSQVLLVTTREEMAGAVQQELKSQLARLSRASIAENALVNSRVVVLDDLPSAMDLVNLYAPEHLILALENPEACAERVVNAGSVFLGHYSPESVGDYASGTNHTLPTHAYARAYSGVSVDSFMRKVTFQQLTGKGLMNIAETVITMAEAEGLQAHAEAVRVRLRSIQ